MGTVAFAKAFREPLAGVKRQLFFSEYAPELIF